MARVKNNTALCGACRLPMHLHLLDDAGEVGGRMRLRCAHCMGKAWKPVDTGFLSIPVPLPPALGGDSTVREALRVMGANLDRAAEYRDDPGTARAFRAQARVTAGAINRAMEAR